MKRQTRSTRSTSFEALAAIVPAFRDEIGIGCFVSLQGKLASPPKRKASRRTS